jgi:outer membrane immunogenic protein
MKRMLLASAVALTAGGQALAADLPPPMAPPPRAPAAYIPIGPAYNWSGFYIGGNLGAAFGGNGSYSDNFGDSISTSKKTSFIGGGQVGVNYEFPVGVVVGAEAMFDWAPNTSNTIHVTTNPGGATVGNATINNRWLTTATGKLGYAWDRVMLYGKGGWAWVGSSNSSFNTPGGSGAFSGPSNQGGWTAGLGVEWAFAGNWSARAEYDYIGLSNQTFTANTVPGPTVVSANNRSLNIVTAGLNYKFGWGGGWW